jgi:hypothetical protein
VKIESFKGWAKVLGIGWMLLAADRVMAENTTVTAQFVPSVDDPTNNTFTDITSPGMICVIFPHVCDYRKSLSVSEWIFSQSPMTANDPRRGVSITLPAFWRDATVQHTTTGETRVVQMRIDGFGGRFRTDPESTVITGISSARAAHEALWVGGGLGTAPSPCVTKHARFVGPDSYQFLWETPAPVACGKTSAFTIDSARLYNTEFMYQMKWPTPLSMAAGRWEGATSYSVGPGMDIDFGENFIPSYNSLDVQFELTVSHHLRVAFPPGSDRLALEPEGGWMPWLTRGRRPERILRDQPFQFTASVPVKMRVECQYIRGAHCAIENPGGHSVPVQTRISLPPGMHTLTGGPASKMLLTHNADVTAAADRYVAEQTGTLHFEVARSDVETMLPHADTTYSGAVTVVWDSFLMP